MSQQRRRPTGADSGETLELPLERPARALPGSPRLLERYRVPDLSPEARPELGASRSRLVFVAESPHVSEVQPQRSEERRPLCGVAGRQWWSLVGELLEGDADGDTSLERVLGLCSRHGLAVLNAVQFPLDPKIVAKFKDADPMALLGFSKLAGSGFYKRLREGPGVGWALRSLADRLGHESIAGLPVYCLGNDAEWFVTQALRLTGSEDRLAGKIPHPSAWWRKDGLYGRIARERLAPILDRAKLAPGSRSARAPRAA